MAALDLSAASRSWRCRGDLVDLGGDDHRAGSALGEIEQERSSS
jgi:hypothetical protein